VTLWLWGALRQWQRHRIGTFLLIAAYGHGIALSKLIYAGVTAAAEEANWTLP